MSFYLELKRYTDYNFQNLLDSADSKAVMRALTKQSLTTEDFLTLLSPVAAASLEEMAQKASHLTRKYFGRSILLYTPLYLSNFCSNQCLYCSFNTHNDIKRKQLDFDEVEQEAREIARTGMKHILLLTGDSPKIAHMDYLKECVRLLKRHFSSIAIEIYALGTSEYGELIKAGVDNLTIYQETYNEELYQILHVKGPKKNYQYRLDAPDRGAAAGMHGINIGTLLGLDTWQKDVFYTGIHARWLQEKYPHADISVSLPRIRPHKGNFNNIHTVSDRDLVQIMTALRLFLPRCGLTISTRESADFRNRILMLGMTKMSAGSVTSVGGHTANEADTGQFEISDNRNAKEICSMLLKNGYQPVFKDWF